MGLVDEAKAKRDEARAKREENKADSQKLYKEAVAFLRRTIGRESNLDGIKVVDSKLDENVVVVATGNDEYGLALINNHNDTASWNIHAAYRTNDGWNVDRGTIISDLADLGEYIENQSFEVADGVEE